MASSSGIPPQPPAEYPSPTIETIFSDGVINFNNSPQIAKFYLARFDPPISGIGPAISVPVAQVVMSLSAFLQTAAFFKTAADNLSANNPGLAAEWSAAQAATSQTFKFNA